MTGKCGAAAAFNTVFNYTAELYPTVVRSTGLGLSAMAGRIGGIAAPMVNSILHSKIEKYQRHYIYVFTTWITFLKNIFIHLAGLVSPHNYIQRTPFDYLRRNKFYICSIDLVTARNIRCSIGRVFWRAQSIAWALKTHFMLVDLWTGGRKR